MIDPTIIERLKVLYADATKGPWRMGSPSFRCVMDHGGEPHGKGKCTYTLQGWFDDKRDISVDNNPATNSDEVSVVGMYDYECGGVLREEDTKFIVALVNAFPELIRQIESSQLHSIRED